MIRIIIAANYDVFIEHAEAIKQSLVELGVPRKFIFIQDDSRVNRQDQFVYLNFIFKALKDWSTFALWGDCVLVQTEELWNRRDIGVYYGTDGRTMMDFGYERVLEMYDENVKIPVGTQKAVYCPVGYSKAWERNLPSGDEDIDILFHGSVTERRQEFWDKFEDMGLNVVFTQSAYGAKRDALIARSKIDINIKAYDNWSYGPLHCLPAQANKKFMLAEKANGGYGPFKPGLHVAEYDGLDDCVKKVEYWLSHEKERKEFAVNAYNDMVKTCNFTDILKYALGPHPEKGLRSLI